MVDGTPKALKIHTNKIIPNIMIMRILFDDYKLCLKSPCYVKIAVKKELSSSALYFENMHVIRFSYLIIFNQVYISNVTE